MGELNKNLNSDFNDQEMTIMTKQNKQKQLDQLISRFNQTQDKISNVLLLFFKERIKTLYFLIDCIDERHQEMNDNQNNDMDNDNNMEMDDDLIMSVQCVHNQ